MNVNEFWSYLTVCCQLDYATNGFQTLKNYPPDFTFDLIIFDMTGGDCLYPFVRKFGRPPVIAISAFSVPPYISDGMGDHYPNYIPFYTKYYTGRITFLDRLINTFEVNYYVWSRKLFYVPKMIDLARREFGAENLDDFYETERNYTIALVNYHPIFNEAQPLAPNIIPVGGLHIKTPKKLPEDLHKIVTNAANGIILFALGSNVRAENLPDTFLNAMNDCFRTLNQTVLWKIKIEANRIKFAPNVYIKSWFPQNDILGHSNTKLFITHGGLLSTQQSIYHGIPMLGLPFFLDQIQNIERIVAKNYGLKLEYNQIDAHYVCEKIHQVFSNKTYRESVSTASQKIQSELYKPLDKALHWINYILKYRTANEYNIAARDFTFIESTNLDIILFLLGIMFAILWICKKVLMKLLLHKKSNNKKVKNH